MQIFGLFYLATKKVTREPMHFEMHTSNCHYEWIPSGGFMVEGSVIATLGGGGREKPPLRDKNQH